VLEIAQPKERHRIKALEREVKELRRANANINRVEVRVKRLGLTRTSMSRQA
jgi:hypothetical protein